MTVIKLSSRDYRGIADITQLTHDVRNAMDHLWRHVNRDVLFNRSSFSIDTSTDVAC